MGNTVLMLAGRCQGPEAAHVSVPCILSPALVGSWMAEFTVDVSLTIIEKCE